MTWRGQSELNGEGGHFNIAQDVLMLTYSDEVIPQSVLPSVPVSLEYPLRWNSMPGNGDTTMSRLVGAS